MGFKISRTSRWVCYGFMVLAVVACGAPDGEIQDDTGPDISVETLRGSDTHPDWSPDGASIAFISNREGVRVDTAINFEIYRARLDGSDETRLTTNQQFEVDVAWSPDGSEILFKSSRDGNDEVYLMDADGGNQRNLTNSDASDGSPHWSPDGSLILFDSDRGSDGESRLYVMNRDGTDVQLIPNDPGTGYLGRWSPDGEQIAFSSGRDGNGEIYIMNSDGTNVRRLTDNPREDGYARWSPDGTSIAYTAGSFDTDRWSVYLMDSDGSNQRMVLDNVDSGNVAWSPDGNRLLFGRYRFFGDNGGEESQIFIFDLTTGEEIRVPRGDGS